MIMPLPTDPIHGVGVLRDDGEKLQCHACGGWYLHLGAHTFQAHGLTADAYGRRFGLMRRIKLGGPAWLSMRSKRAADHLRRIESPRQARVKRMSTEERRAEQANREWRAEHERTKTEPDRMRTALKVEYGVDHGHPDAFIKGVVAPFVEELRRGQRGVYKRLGNVRGRNCPPLGRG